MAKYSIGGIVTVSVYTIVEAESEAEARRLANERGTQSFCHQCSSQDAEEEWVLSDSTLDGTPEINDVTLEGRNGQG